MTPIDDRELGKLESRVNDDHENVAELFAKVDKLTEKLTGYVEKHGDVHASISGQLRLLMFIEAVLLVAIGAALAKLLGS